MIEIKMNNFPLNSINSISKHNAKGNDHIAIALDYFVKLFLKRKFWKKVHYYVMFSALVRLFLIHLSIFYRKMPSLDKRKFLFHYKETFSRMSEYTSLQKQIKQVFFRGITFRIYILETSKRRR